MTRTDVPAPLGPNSIRVWREARGWSLAQLADVLDTQQPPQHGFRPWPAHVVIALAQLEAGTRGPVPGELDALAVALGVGVAQLTADPHPTRASAHARAARGLAARARQLWARSRPGRA